MMRIGVFLLFLFVFPISALAWETLVNENEGKGTFSWKSIYQQPDLNQAAAEYPGKANKPDEESAEHTRLADMALNRLGVGHIFNRQGTGQIHIIDLNANLFRAEDMHRLPTEGDDPKTAIEERLIVTPAHFSGMPDYSYTIYDWLNKNQYCAAGAAQELQEKCHVFFMGWLGNLNSTHFGSQAKNMYHRYHSIAKQLANRAKYLNETIRQEGGNAAYEEYKSFIKEAEIEALAYEGYAQHFLQDRWAIGHMWERWGSGNYDQLPDKSNATNTLIGAVAGMLHGSEAVLNKTYNINGTKVNPDDYLNTADPLSSPQIIDKNTAEPLKWRHDNIANGSLIGGVGDERLTDMEDGMFGAEYIPYKKDFSINVKQQQKEMMRCSMAGWAEIIRKFGKQNAHEVVLQNDPSFDVLEAPECWDMWATNSSIEVGITKDKALNYSVVSRLAFGAPDGFADKALAMLVETTSIFGAVLGVARANFNKSLVKMLYNIEVATLDDPDGTNLAKGEIGPIFGTNTGNKYNIPDYVEPFFIDKLPDKDKQGRDKETIFGAFSRAHSDHWCTNLKAVFKKYDLRGSDNPRKQEMCLFLADLAYDRTDKFYDGEQKEERKVGDKVIPSICTIRNHPLPKPIYPFATLGDQGFVPYGKHGKPQDKTDNGMTYKTVENWCKELPTITLPSETDEADLRNKNIVAEVAGDEDNLEIEGFNFGDNMGKISAIDMETEALTIIPTRKWMEWSIELNVSDAGLEGGKTYRLELETAPDENGSKKISVGLFKLKIKPAAEIVIKDLDLTGLGPCRTNLESIKTVDILKSLPEDPSAITAKYLGKMVKAYESYHRDVATTLDAQADCMEKLHNQLKAQYQEHLEPVFTVNGFYSSYAQVTRNVANYVRQIDWELKGWEAILKNKDWFYLPGPEPFGLVTDADKHKNPLAAAPKTGFDMSKINTTGNKQAKKLFDQMAVERKKSIGNALNERFDYLERLLQNTVTGLTNWTQVEDKLHRQMLPRLAAHIDSLPKTDEYGNPLPIQMEIHEFYREKFYKIAGRHPMRAYMDAEGFSNYMLLINLNPNKITKWPGEQSTTQARPVGDIYQSKEIELPKAIPPLGDDFGTMEAPADKPYLIPIAPIPTPIMAPLPTFQSPDVGETDTD
ncbi:MAG: hypothetical protein JKX99_00710 [Robiginitomaculum sp.]|nr:hypothetical protein [Robiginitomaculum sp.]